MRHSGFRRKGMGSVAQFSGASNTTDLARLILLLVRRDTGPLTPLAQAMLRVLDRAAANGAALR